MEERFKVVRFYNKMLYGYVISDWGYIIDIREGKPVVPYAGSETVYIRLGGKKRCRSIGPLLKETFGDRRKFMKGRMSKEWYQRRCDEIMKEFKGQPAYHEYVRKVTSLDD